MRALWNWETCRKTVKKCNARWFYLRNGQMSPKRHTMAFWRLKSLLFIFRTHRIVRRENLRRRIFRRIWLVVFFYFNFFLKAPTRDISKRIKIQINFIIKNKNQKLHNLSLLTPHWVTCALKKVSYKYLHFYINPHVLNILITFIW